MKNVYLHYNPVSNYSARGIKNMSRNSYNRFEKFGTIFIQEVPDNFIDSCILHLKNGLNDISLSYGETKLAYDDRMKYNKSKGRSYSMLQNKLSYVRIKSVEIFEEYTVVFLCTKIYEFDFKIEINNKTKKVFASTLNNW